MARTVSSPNLDAVDLEEAKQLVEQVNSQGGTYHRLDFGDGLVIEAERRGAKVTAIDIWDESALPAQLARTFKLGIDYVPKDLYDLDSEFGEFDLVICGSLLLHLPDPVGALRSVTKERLVLSSAATADSVTTSQPVCHFTGARASESDYWSYWAFSACTLERMLLAAEFSRIDDVAHFELRSEPGRMPFVTPHVSMSACV